MKKELYLPPEARATKMSMNTGILVLSTTVSSSTIEDYYYEELDTE